MTAQRLKNSKTGAVCMGIVNGQAMAILAPCQLRFKRSGAWGKDQGFFVVGLNSHTTHPELIPLSGVNAASAHAAAGAASEAFDDL